MRSVLLRIFARIFGVHVKIDGSSFGPVSDFEHNNSGTNDIGFETLDSSTDNLAVFPVREAGH